MEFLQPETAYLRPVAKGAASRCQHSIRDSSLLGANSSQELPAKQFERHRPTHFVVTAWGRMDVVAVEGA